jgi:hypothetical protein
LAEPADEFVTSAMLDYLSDPQWIVALMRKHAKGTEIQAMADRLTELHSNERLLQRDRYNPPKGERRLDHEIFDMLMSEIERERREIEHRMQASRENAMLAETLRFGGGMAEEWGERSDDWRRAIIRMVTVRIEVMPRGRGGEPGQPYRLFDASRIHIAFAE